MEGANESGNVRRAQEQFYVKGRFVWLDSLLHDLQFALRQMRRSPGFALTAVLTLALGIAANVIVFGVLEALIQRTIDRPHADRIMTLAHTGTLPGVFPIRRCAISAITIQCFLLLSPGTLTILAWRMTVLPDPSGDIK